MRPYKYKFRRGFRPDPKDAFFRRFTQAMKFLFVFAMVCFAYSFVEPYLIQEKTTLFRDSDVPAEFVGQRIVFISDIHHDQFYTRDRVAAVVRKVNALEPDIIILGGDYVFGDKKYIESVFAELSQLRAKTKIYGVVGNHDDWEDYDLTVECMKKAGITVLSDKAEWITLGNQRIKIAGIDWYYKNEPDISPLLRDAKKEDFVLFVSHVPDFAEKLKTDKIDLLLSGHTHGGEVTFFGLWAPYIPSDYGQKYRTGLVRTDKTTVLISNGVGNSFLPIRFFARPQINIIELAK
jgi:predicted MPP superfamily phosphohydrolase